MGSSARQWGLLVAFFAGLAIYNTSINNFYQYGATFFDSTIFVTNMWRTDWALSEAPSFNHVSYFVTHMSPLLWIPNFFSYFFPGDYITYFALVYALVFATLVYYAYAALLPLFASRFAAPLAAAAAFLYFNCEALFQSAWEMHMEQASPLLILLAFIAWQKRRYYMALFWILMNCALREDLGAINAIPVVLLAGAQWLELRKTDPLLARERLRWGAILASVSIAASVAGFAVQKLYFPGFDLFHAIYFDKNNPLGHLTGQVVYDRLVDIFYHRVGDWLPLLILMVAAAVYRDVPLVVGAVAFLPYIFVNFISKDGLSSSLDSYKVFPITLAMLWPALMAISHPEKRKSYLYVQMAVLVCGLADYPAGYRFNNYQRWFPQPYTQNAQAYRDFGIQLGDSVPTDAGIRASHSLLALYPYRFGPWYQADINDIAPENYDRIKELIWFEDDRDQDKVKQVLEAVPFTSFTQVPGTRIHIAKR